jgi:DNA-binding NarL/FixJ family response regulator
VPEALEGGALTRVNVSAAQPVVRAGLEALLRAGGRFEVVDRQASADVLVSDREPGHAEGPPVLLLTTEAAALSDRVHGVLPAETSEAELAAGVEAVAAGLLVLHPHFANQASLRHGGAALTEPLTAREQEVLTLLAEGVANKEIAWRLRISEHTVKFHVASVLDKLDAQSRTEAVSRGIRAGLIVV